MIRRFLTAVVAWIAAIVTTLPTAQAASNPYPGRPSTAPISADSAFEPALACMDELLSRSTRDSAGLFLFPAGIVDPTDKGGFTRDMIINAATKMSQRSHFFQILLDPAQAKSKIYIQTGGSVTAFENGVQSKEGGGGISIASVIGGTARASTTLSNITVSLFFMGSNQVLIDGTFHSHTLYISSRSKNAFFSSFLEVIGGSLSFGGTQTDGPQAGVKALIDLAMIEAVGNFAQVPYTTCLARVVKGDEQAADFSTFKKLGPTKQRAMVLEQLGRRGLIGDNPSESELQQALLGFQRAQGLTPNGEIDFALYRALKRLDQGTYPLNRPENGNPSVKVSGVPGPFQYARGSLPTAAVGDKLAFQATVAEPAFVACYYTDADGQVSRVFPNRTRPIFRLMPGEVLRMPSERDSYAIMPRKSGAPEWFTCFAGREDITDRLESVLPSDGLRPLADVHTADELYSKVHSAFGDITSDTLTYLVR